MIAVESWTYANNIILWMPLWQPWAICCNIAPYISSLSPTGGKKLNTDKNLICFVNLFKSYLVYLTMSQTHNKMPPDVNKK